MSLSKQQAYWALGLGVGGGAAVVGSPRHASDAKSIGPERGRELLSVTETPRRLGSWGQPPVPQVWPPTLARLSTMYQPEAEGHSLARLLEVGLAQHGTWLLLATSPRDPG